MRILTSRVDAGQPARFVPHDPAHLTDQLGTCSQTSFTRAVVFAGRTAYQFYNVVGYHKIHCRFETRRVKICKIDIFLTTAIGVSTYLSCIP